MKCPKCKFVNVSGATECADCGVQFVDIRGGRGYRPHADKVDRTCPWNDHGNVCGLVGSLSDSTNGQGPWYCSKHWWQLKGYPLREDEKKPHISYRERWYQERGLPYEPPKMEAPAPWVSVGSGAVELYARLRAGELGPRQQRMREPGEDLDEAA